MYSTPPPRPDRSASPQIKSPFSCKPFLADASSSAVDVPEQPYVLLDDWWLLTVEGHEGKISVGGFYGKGKEQHEFIAAPIAKRHDPCTLETEDGILVFLKGYFNGERTLENGFTTEACERFCIGFPYWWDEWKVFRPNIMNSQTGSQPRSSRTCNLRKDSTLLSASTLGSTYNESNVGIDNASRISKGCQKTTITYVRRQAGEATDVPSSEKGKQPVGPSRKQRSAVGKLHRATRSPNIRSRSPYNGKELAGNQVQPKSTKINGAVIKRGRGRPKKTEVEQVDRKAKLLDGEIRGKMNEENQSPITRGIANSLSMYTPESLKLKKTKSGRVVVPTLVSGCQNIIYAPDGSICAIVGLESPLELKGNMTKVYVRKSKRTS